MNKLRAVIEIDSGYGNMQIQTNDDPVQVVKILTIPNDVDARYEDGYNPHFYGEIGRVLTFSIIGVVPND